MKKWQIGFTYLTWEGDPAWQDKYVEAETKKEAEELAIKKSFPIMAHNVFVREV